MTPDLMSIAKTFINHWKLQREFNYLLPRNMDILKSHTSLTQRHIWKQEILPPSVNSNESVYINDLSCSCLDYSNKSLYLSLPIRIIRFNTLTTWKGLKTKPDKSLIYPFPSTHTHRCVNVGSNLHVWKG